MQGPRRERLSSTVTLSFPFAPFLHHKRVEEDIREINSYERVDNKITVAISTKNFASKPGSDDLKDLSYRIISLYPIELLDKVMMGYCYQGHYDYQGEFQFKGTGAKSQHYIGTYVVSIDIDHTDVPMRQFLKGLRDLPYFAYETFSSKVGNYCYRLCYVFTEELIGKDTYASAYETLCKRNGIKNYDKCATSAYQYFNGTRLDADICETRKTYTLDEIGVCNIINPNCTFDKEDKLDGKGYFSDDLVKELDDLDYHGIVSKYANTGTYRNKQCSPIPKVSDDVKIIPLPKDFYEITRPWVCPQYATSNIINPNCTFSKGYIRKLKNGEHRRYRLYDNLCIRRLILPDLTLDELLYDACYEMNYFIDNTDKTDIITKSQVMSIVLSAYKRDLSTFNYVRPRETMVNWIWCKNHNVTKRMVAKEVADNKRKDMKENKKKIFFELYNKNLTIKENIENFIEQTGIKVSERTVKMWKKELGMTREYNVSNTTSNIIIPNCTLDETPTEPHYIDDSEDIFLDIPFEGSIEYNTTLKKRHKEASQDNFSYRMVQHTIGRKTRAYRASYA